MCRKVPHSSKSQARAHAERLVRRGLAWAIGIYKCPRCNKWEMTHSRASQCKEMVSAAELGVGWMFPLFAVIDNICGDGEVNSDRRTI